MSTTQYIHPFIDEMKAANKGEEGNYRRFAALPAGNYKLSVQASTGHYSRPRTSLPVDRLEEYEQFEVAILDSRHLVQPRNFIALAVFPWAELFEEGSSPVAPWVPAHVVQDMLDDLRSVE